MSFFKDFKDDLSQAVNELMPDEELLEDEGEDSSDVMVNTLEGDLDIESELSKLDGLLEPAPKKEEVKRQEIQPEEPVMERPARPEPKPDKTRIAREPARREPAPAVKRTRPQEPAPVLNENNLELVDLDHIMKEEQKDSPEEISQMDVFEEELAARKANRPLAAAPKAQEAKARTESVSAAARPLPQPEKPPVIQSIFHNKNTGEASAKAGTATKTNNKIGDINKTNAMKEEAPMNDEMTTETMNLEDELSSVTPEITDEVSIITEGTTIKGNLQTTGSFSISGTIEGDVQCNGKLEVTGMIKGNSSSSEIFADAAKIEGEITSTGTVKIGLGSVVVGNITATSAVIAGAVKGDIDVQGPVVVDTSAVIVGNIKSRSVQINNGAVIEGFCSQCYADIDVDTLFGEKKGN